MNYSFSEKVSHLQASAIREILKFTSDPEVISFAAGNPAPEAFPVEEIERISKEIFAQDPILALQYSITEGYPKLREQLKEKFLKTAVKVPVDSTDIVSKLIFAVIGKFHRLSVSLDKVFASEISAKVGS